METDFSTRLSKRHQSRFGFLGFEEGEYECGSDFCCPFCAEYFDVVGLCCHIDDEHPVEAENGVVCPVCAARVGIGLVEHITTWHENLFKMQRRRRYHKGSSGSNSTLSLLRKELREGNLQSLFGGSSFAAAPSDTTPDPLLSSFITNLPAADSSKDELRESIDEESLGGEASEENEMERYNMPRRGKRITIDDGNESHGDEQPLHNSGSQTDEGEGSTPPTVKKHRGRTKMANIWKIKNDERIVVEVNGVGQPVGDNASKFFSFIGVIARNPRILPLSYESWPKVPTTTKVTAITTIKQYFSFAGSFTPWVEKSLSKKWRDYKSDLKAKYFDKDLSEAENASDVPQNVELLDWQFLVHYWSSVIGQKRAEVGVASRSKQLVLHTAGTQSFALVRKELEEDLGGPTEFGDIDFFDATHKSKDGTYASPEAARILANARRRYDEISSASDSDPTAAPTDWRTRQRVALTEVRGKERHGRVRGMGLGPTPSRLFGRSESSSSANRDEEMTSLKAQVALLQEQMAHLIGQQSQVPPSSGRPDEGNSDDQN